ncbi:MAG TPA: 2-oxoacid:acceptor oxidoreductase subunit alpha [Saprospiraceae bacterium]|nr:2-oxoacid:acceptor oxidoreductase subunit alpha [Saprospiraceae bacterium]
MTEKKLKLTGGTVDSVVIRFVGDSGDGMQLTGTQFSDTSAMMGNDIATFPNYPSEIRAPQGSIYGVSGFQVQIGHATVHTPGDEVDVLVAMNPAALKTNLSSVPVGKTIIVDTDSFNKKNLQKAEYDENPLLTGELNNFVVIEAPITTLTRESIADIGLDNKAMTRSKNMFALGMVFWMFSRPLKYTETFIDKKFAGKTQLIEANKRALRAGFNFAETIELISSAYTILPAKMDPGIYRIISGNTATAWGFLAASEKSGRPIFLGSYPITPATEILQELTAKKYFGAKTFQAEDEIAGISTAIGASFSGHLAITTTSGPGLALKGEAIGLAVMTELPIVIVDVQRAGPSTGLPTKPEQSDLLQAMYGRHGESPVIVVAAKSPADCFNMAFEASRLAMEHMTPVILLTDGYIANGSEPWKIKKTEDLPIIYPNDLKSSREEWMPYKRDPETLAREWVLPGTPGFEHRVGGLEKKDGTGDVNQSPENHQLMVKLRAEKICRVKNNIPLMQVDGAQEGDLLVIGWGGTYGSLFTAVNHLFESGQKIGLMHFSYLNPMPKNTEEILKKFKKFIICELNMGQLHTVMNSKFPEYDYFKFNKVQGLPFTVLELTQKFEQILNNQ